MPSEAELKVGELVCVKDEYIHRLVEGKYGLLGYWESDIRIFLQSPALMVSFI